MVLQRSAAPLFELLRRCNILACPILTKAKAQRGERELIVTRGVLISLTKYYKNFTGTPSDTSRGEPARQIYLLSQAEAVISEVEAAKAKS